MTDRELLELAKEGLPHYADSEPERLIFERLLTALPEIERLRAESFALAAGQCANVTGDDGGTPVCKEVLRLRAALIEARNSVESWAAYASPYFQEKHDLDGDLARLDAVIAARAT
jgi:hypothetical protein